MTDPVSQDDLDSLRWSMQDGLNDQLDQLRQENDFLATRVENLEKSLAVTQAALTSFIFMTLGDDRGREMAERLIEDQAP